MRIPTLLAVLVLLAMVVVPGVHAQAFVPIETFSNYDVSIQLLPSGDAKFTHRITIRNNDKDNPIVPGIAYLNVFNNTEKTLEIEDINTTLANGSRLVHFMQKQDEYYEIRFELWFPLGPQKEQEVIVEYTAKHFFPTNGLFRTIQFPVGDSTIPIEKGTISVSSPLAITYAPDAVNDNGRTIWQLGSIAPGQNKSIEFEIGEFPLPQLPIKGAYVFYALVAIVGLIVIATASGWIRKQKRGGR